jgi:hypothetical protein
LLGLLARYFVDWLLRCFVDLYILQRTHIQRTHNELINELINEPMELSEPSVVCARSQFRNR